MISFRTAAGVLLCLLLAACAAELEPVTAIRLPTPEQFPEDLYLRASTREPVYRIDPADSGVLVYVYRDGPLAKLGHDHVVASHEVRGYALLPGSFADARTDIYFPVATMTMDEPGLRRDAGFKTEISADDVEITRRRMLRAVLEAKKYPFIRIHAAVLPTGGHETRLKVVLTLHGVARALTVPVQFGSDPETFSVHGATDIHQSDFGITPFSIFGGALAVSDQLHVIFWIRGSRVDPRE